MVFATISDKNVYCELATLALDESATHTAVDDVIRQSKFVTINDMIALNVTLSYELARAMSCTS